MKNILKKTRNLKSHLMLVAAAAIWGFAFVAQRSSSTIITPFLFNASRFFLGSAVLLPIAVISGRIRRFRAQERRSYFLAALCCGGMIFAGTALQQIGMAQTTASKAGFLTGFYIIFVPIIGILMHVKPPALIWPSAALALTGLFLLACEKNFAIESGDATVFASSIFYAIQIITIDIFSPCCTAILLSIAQFFVAGLLSLACAFVFENPSVAQLLSAKWEILYTGVMSTGVAYTLQVAGQKNCNPSSASLLLCLESFFAAVGGLVLLRETMSARTAAGCAMLFCGIIMSQIDPSQIKSSRDRNIK